MKFGDPPHYNFSPPHAVVNGVSLKSHRKPLILVPPLLYTPLIPTSARRAMTEQAVCRALGERSSSGHRAPAERKRSVAARQALGGRSWGLVLVGISGV